LTPIIGFDFRISWQDGSPTEHSSSAELCFKARHGVETVICRVPRRAILNALNAHTAEEECPDRADDSEDLEERQICEALFVTHRQTFRALAQNKIRAGAFAEPMGHVRSILIDEGELSSKAREAVLLH
jgi:hypothetical protein